MLNIYIKDKRYTCISLLKEMNLSYARYVFEYIKGVKDVDKLLVDKTLLTMLSNFPENLINSLNDKNVMEVLSEIDFLKNLNFTEYTKYFILNKKRFKILNFNDLTVKEYAEIDYYLTNYKNEFEVLHNVINILIRRITKSDINILYYIKKRIIQKNFIPIKVKNCKLTTWDEDNSELFDKRLDAEIAFHLFYDYIEWRNSLMKEYPDIWSLSEDDEDEVPENSPSRIDKWGFYSYVWEMSSSLSEREAWYDKNIRQFLKALSYIIVKKEETK